MSLDFTTVSVAVALLFAAFVKGTSGMGFPLIATPMVALLLDIRTAITILIIPNIVMDVAQVFRGGFPAAVMRRFGWFFVTTVAGVFLGTRALVALPLWTLNFCLGLMVLFFVTSSWLKFDFAISPALEKKLALPAGLAGGFLNGLTNAAGPAVAIYLYSLRLSKHEFIKSIATIFMVTKLSQLAAVSTWNLFNVRTMSLSLAVTGFILLGFYAGLKTQDRINQRTFNRVLLVLLFAIGSTLVVRALSQRG
ncbi:MAG TPA: sulfite exporter TauE/SafE family protein [candidate division Zixibacteria bacterium]|nr:sulfite exporter TauE/SafE family protein [candidate division Zixibacteria bacterium]